MAQCVSSPTLTSFGVGTTQSVSTTASLYVTTPPGSIYTTLVPTCATVSNSTTCATSTQVVTQPGTPYETAGQVVVTVNAPYTYSTTLYGSSCTTTLPDDPNSGVSSTTTATTTTSSSDPVVIPVVSTVTSSSVYTSDGSTYITLVTSLSSALPVQATTTSSSSPSSESHVPAIIGGALGGLSAVVLLTLLAWKFLWKPRTSFDKDDYPDFKGNQDQGSKPYHYNPARQQNSQGVAQVSPNRAGLQQTGYGNDSTAFNNGIAGTGGDTVIQYAGATSNGYGPTVAGNEAGLQPGVHNNDVMYDVPNYGPVHQTQSSTPTPLVTGSAAIAGARLGARQNTTLSSPTYMSAADPTGQQVNYPPNMVYPQQYPSHLSGPPYSQQQPYGSSLQGPPGSSLGVGTGPSVPIIQPGQVYQPRQLESQGDSLSGSQSVGSVGSPNNQLLQVSNPGPDTFIEDSSTGRPSSSLSPPPIHGTGDARGEKAAIVYLDGGAYSESSNPAPPAYRE